MYNAITTVHRYPNAHHLAQTRSKMTVTSGHVVTVDVTGDYPLGLFDMVATTLLVDADDELSPPTVLRRLVVPVPDFRGRFLKRQSTLRIQLQYPNKITKVYESAI